MFNVDEKVLIYCMHSVVHPTGAIVSESVTSIIKPDKPRFMFSNKLTHIIRGAIE